MSRPLCLRFRAPYDWDAMLAFLGARATPGVEAVEAGRYRRTVRIAGQAGAIEVTRTPPTCALRLHVRGIDREGGAGIRDRVSGMFDLGADPAAVARTLRSDPLLGRPWARHQGIRIPGAWDPFELTVRAILGQQVSVRAATTMAGRVAALFGTPVAVGPGLQRLFPDPAQLADADVARAGVMPARAATIRRLARAVLEGGVRFDGPGGMEEALAGLTAIPGIGDWTAQYVAMRALGHRDALPAGDLVLRRAAGGCSARELDRRSATWRPWRAYAVMLIWQDASDAARPRRVGRHAPHPRP